MIAICDEATIETTTGCVEFDGKERRHPRRRREVGSMFSGTLRLTPEQAGAIRNAVKSVLVPSGVALRCDGVLLPRRPPVATVEETLATEIADEEGYLRPTSRRTTVEIHEPATGEVPTLYEMGIPVVETGDRWHVNVGQKVPLNVDRDNVTPAYLRHVRTVVVNAMAAKLTRDDAARPWVAQALGDERIAPEAVDRVLTARYGDRRVVADPSDPEGTKIAVSKGYVVIQPGSFSGDAWANIRKSGAALPAGHVTPSPRPFSPDGSPLKMIEKLTDSMKAMSAAIRKIARELIGQEIAVALANDSGWPFAACFGGGRLTVNVARLGRGWFDLAPSHVNVMRLLLHEFAHARVSDHLSHEFHEEVARLGGCAVQIAIKYPHVFEKPVMAPAGVEAERQ